MLGALGKKIVDLLASRNIAGPELEDALLVCRWADQNGFYVNIEPWALPKDTPKSMVERYSTSLNAVKSLSHKPTVGVKVAAFGNDIGMFKGFVEVARSMDVSVFIGSVGPESADMTFRFLESAAPLYGKLGCTLPSRWRRSLDDAERLIELGLYVRVVKGQWIDPGAPRLDCRKNFISIVEKLAGRARNVGIATHDYHLAEKSVSILSSSRIEVEIDQFFSLPLNAIDLARKFGCPYRLHVSYGGPGLPYNARFISERPEMVAWIVSDILMRRKQPWSAKRKNKNS